MYLCVYTHTYVSIACFLKVHIIPPNIYKMPTLVPISSKWKKSEEDFAFIKKVKTVFNTFLQQAIREALCTLSSEGGTAKLLPWELDSASLH